ncbi:hypothetical protein Sjap_023150 [Stephania japonica]|uniref:Uncharacterized protein n=1 Tax=Stephania japonica TaxID=461633 RepID=A0AAP0EFF1_9MAGN
MQSDSSPQPFQNPHLHTTLLKPPPKFTFIATDDECFYVRGTSTDDAVSANQCSNSTSKQHLKPPVVVFVGSRIGADLLSEEAITVTTGIKALSIHGEKPMKERREILRLFLTGRGK